MLYLKDVVNVPLFVERFLTGSHRVETIANPLTMYGFPNQSAFFTQAPPLPEPQQQTVVEKKKLYDV